jgi:endoglucanase
MNISIKKLSMKKIKTILPLLLCLLLFGFTVQAAPSIIGKWFGLKDGSPVIVDFRNDQTMSIQADAFSSLSFTCRYKIDSSVSPATIDLIDIPGGMVCSAIIRFSGNSDMEFFGFFGAPGYTQRPASIDANSKKLEALYLKLSRAAKMIAKSPSVVSHPPKAAKLAFERNKRLGRGLNLNGLLDNNSGDLHLYKIPDQPIKPEYIKMIAKAGFNSVRLPITWSVHSSKTPPYTIEPAFFAKVDSIVKLCLKNGLAVSIDMHYYPYINMVERDSSISFNDNIKRFYSLWEQIAEHYKSYPPELYFDLLNEPNMEVGVQLYNQLIAKSLKLIRKTNPHRTILIGTPNLGQSWTIGLLELPKDDWNLIVQIHYYLPHLFTHQGLAYARAESGLGLQWTGTPEEKKPIKSDFNYCAKWSKANVRPINLGEFGVNEHADMASRARYINFVRELAEMNGFSFHLWGFREIFRVFDEETGQWQQPVLDALVPGKN